jgi:heterotetrameric sarcosine oxidase delta subunit
MSFFIACPSCGPREVNEFRYGGEIVTPSSDTDSPAGSNQPRVQKERWFHRLGCRRWLVAERDVRTNSVLRTAWLEGEA